MYICIAISGPTEFVRIYYRIYIHILTYYYQNRTIDNFDANFYYCAARYNNGRKEVVIIKIGFVPNSISKNNGHRKILYET